MPRVLIVDGDVDAANALASLLQSSGYGDARVAYTGATALALVVEFAPTVLLVDLDLPDMSGYDVARQLSKHTQPQNPSQIALTANSEHPGRECNQSQVMHLRMLRKLPGGAIAALVRQIEIHK